MAMSGQLTPQMTVPAAPVRNTLDDFTSVATGTALGALRRAAIRLRAAHVTRGMIRELLAVPQTTAPGTPLFARLDALQERYAQLGGDPADLAR
jgi:arginine/lysine/ornithine decarboxylase